jgi:hypothetical protein
VYVAVSFQKERGKTKDNDLHEEIITRSAKHGMKGSKDDGRQWTRETHKSHATYSRGGQILGVGC